MWGDKEPCISVHIGYTSGVQGPKAPLGPCPWARRGRPRRLLVPNPRVSFAVPRPILHLFTLGRFAKVDRHYSQLRTTAPSEGTTRCPSLVTKSLRQTQHHGGGRGARTVESGRRNVTHRSTDFLSLFGSNRSKGDETKPSCNRCLRLKDDCLWQPGFSFHYDRIGAVQSSLPQSLARKRSPSKAMKESPFLCFLELLKG